MGHSDTVGRSWRGAVPLLPAGPQGVHVEGAGGVWVLLSCVMSGPQDLGAGGSVVETSHPHLQHLVQNNFPQQPSLASYRYFSLMIT